MLRWLVYVAVALGALVLLILLVGWALPVGHRASRTRSLAAPPGRIFSVVSDFGRSPEWRTGLDRVEIAGSSGSGQVVREFSRDGELAFTVEVLTPPSRLVTRITGDGLPFGGTWTYDIAPGPDGGTTITITEDGEIYNVIFRFAARFYFGYDATIETYLRDLARKMGEG